MFGVYSDMQKCAPIQDGGFLCDARAKLHFITILVVTSHENNACSVFALEACLHTTRVRMDVDPLKAKDADMEKALLSHDVTTKVLVK